MSREKARYRRDEVPVSGSAAAHGIVFQDGQTVQVMGSRETLVTEAGRWVSENNDLGGKLDALNAVVKENTEVLLRIEELMQAIFTE